MHLVSSQQTPPWPDRDDELRFYCQRGVAQRQISRAMQLPFDSVKDRVYRLALDIAYEGVAQHPSSTKGKTRRQLRDYYGCLRADIPTLPPLPSLQQPLPRIHIGA